MKKQRKRRLWLWIAALIAAVLCVFLCGAWSMFGEKIQAAMTVRKLDDKLYAMSYEGDYGFDAYMESGGGETSEDMARYITSYLSGGFVAVKEEPAPIGCTTVAVRDGAGSMLMGRNYDWEKCDTMIVHTKPEKGYASVSTACLDFLGFGKDWKPDESMMNRIMALAAVYVPLDGINEKGLCIADLMAGDKEETHQSSGKTDLTTTAAIRMILDHAATVDEAIALLKGIDMHSDIGSAHHYAISDAAGNAVVVEYVNGEMLVCPSPIVTNHYLSDTAKKGVGSEQSHRRFETMTKHYAAANGVMERAQVRDALAAVAQSNFGNEYDETVWSIVFDSRAKEAVYYFGEKYDAPYTVKLEGFEIVKTDQ